MASIKSREPSNFTVGTKSEKLFPRVKIAIKSDLFAENVDTISALFRNESDYKN